jgi:SAM-dependent methyltransferase
MDREYYTRYYTYERTHWWFRARANILRDRVKKLAGDERSLRILNIGAATGYSSEWLGEFGEVVSVEYDKDCCVFLNEKLHIKAVNASITALPFDMDTFDLVCAFDVIEHVDDDLTAVQEMVRVCRPGGTVFVTVPAYMGLWSKHDETNHHKRRYVRRHLRELFRLKSGTIENTSYFNTLLFPMIWLARKVANLLPRSDRAGQRASDFELGNSRFLDTVLYFIFSAERVFLRIIRFPFGVSILLLFRKTNDPQHHATAKTG